LWLANEGLIEHVTGCGYDQLFFNYPLTGTFEFSCDVMQGQFSQADVGYGGLVLMPQAWLGTIDVAAVTQQDRITRTIAKDPSQGWHATDVKVTPRSIQFFHDGQLRFEDIAPSSTSPWLHLAALDQRQAQIRNLELRGKPEIPREVRLIDGDRLDGWTANY